MSYSTITMKCFGIELYGLLWLSCLYDFEASATSVAISAASYQQTTAYYLRIEGHYQTIRCHNPEDHGIIHRTDAPCSQSICTTFDSQIAKVTQCI
jgi:hypothetical protein